MNNKTILVTGGAGYIGSHACVELLEAGHEVIVVDNLSNSKLESLNRVKQISGRSVIFYNCDIRDKPALSTIFAKHSIAAVLHFAGLKAVGESCQQPLLYYQNNVYGALVLAQVMAQANVKCLVFSSSATVYGEPDTVQYTEHLPIFGATNPYGKSKAMVEDIFKDLATADTLSASPTPWKIMLLRYFNPIGAHPSGLIGEDPNGIPNNLVPYVAQVAIGKLKQLSIFGNDYPTRDGTGVRDYIHVLDLVQGHLKALDNLSAQEANVGVCKAYNLGTGKGYSVLEIVRAFEQLTQRKINFKYAPRRAGDIAENYADPTLALKELGWRSEKNLHDMVNDSWHWQTNNPQGYE